MATASRREHRDVKVLHNIPFDVYARMVEDPANARLRMAYHDGTLELVSPIHFRHELPSIRLSLLVMVMAEVLGLEFQAVGSSTFKRRGDGERKGHGKEPDQAFYLASLPRVPWDRELDLNAGDPPPDLWIEVDNRASSAGRLPIYAALGVSEVWQYGVKSRTIRFHHLVERGYEPIDTSMSLPPLTPALIQEILDEGRDIPDSRWLPRLRNWARRFAPEPTDGV